MKFFVTGGSGLLGSNFVSLAGSIGHEVIATGLRHKATLTLDITDRAKTLKVISENTPDVVVHSAAMANVDQCENERDAAWMANVDGTRNVADACLRSGAKLIFISTDYVFDGKHGPYSEDDETNPINFYGRTKLEAERIVLALGERAAVVRTTVIYGFGGHKQNFVTWVIDALRKGNRTPVVTDQFNSPTFAKNCAEGILAISEKNASGIYNIVGRSCTNRHDFAVKIAQKFGLRSELLVPVDSVTLNQPAKRPKNSCLLTGKAERELDSKIKFLTVDEGLESMKVEAQEGQWAGK